MERCLFCHKVVRGKLRRAKYCDPNCGSQHRKTKDYYDEIDSKNSINSERWLLTGLNSSNEAMMEVHRLFNPDNITYNA